MTVLGTTYTRKIDVAISGATSIPQFAKQLGIPHAHLYNYKNKGVVSPTLQKALVKAGILPPPPPSRAGYRRRAAWIPENKMGDYEKLLKQHNCKNLTQLIETLLT